MSSVAYQSISKGKIPNFNWWMTWLERWENIILFCQPENLQAVPDALKQIGDHLYSVVDL